jgi:EEF1A lysine methyltransferase 4
MASSQYGRLEYWEERYTHKKETFEWYQHWNGIKDIVTQFVKPNHSILHAGCGTSALPFEMQSEGYTKITNCDNCKTLVEDMRSNHPDNNMQWHLKDVRAMDYPSGAFGAVIEKGLLDSILCGDRSRIMASRMLSEVYRVLESKGVYISVTHAPPELRNRYFDTKLWKVHHYEVSKIRISSVPIEEGERHHIYVCIKIV